MSALLSRLGSRLGSWMQPVFKPVAAQCLNFVREFANHRHKKILKLAKGRAPGAAHSRHTDTEGLDNTSVDPFRFACRLPFPRLPPAWRALQGIADGQTVATQ